MEKREVSSDEARRTWRDLLDAVKHNGEHVTVLRYGNAVAIMVPAGWYEQAQAAIGEQEAS